jgi:hypothetical protein
MAYVMTTQGSTGCTHGGIGQLPSSAKLKVNGSAVLLAPDVTTKWSIKPGCSQTDTSKSMVVCAKFMSIAQGQSSKLKVNGQAVVLDTFSGKTNGNPDQSTQPASAGQSKLSAT